MQSASQQPINDGDGKPALFPYGFGLTYDTPPGDDTTPPSVPGTPTASGVTSTGATLTWSASTDNIGVSGYDVVRVQGSTETVVATPTTATAALTGLTPATAYTFAVYARDAAGNRSGRSGTVAVNTPGTVTTTTSRPPVTTTTTRPPVTTTTSPPVPGGCTVAYTIMGQWGGQFQAEIRLTNTSTTALTSWTMTFAFPNGQTINQIWGASRTQSGANVTLVSDWAGNVPANGGSVAFGFIGTWNNSANGEPTAFTLNGTPCTVV
jgi:hypothetical protein